MKTRRLMTIGLGALVLSAALFGACGGDDDDGASGDKTATTSSKDEKTAESKDSGTTASGDKKTAEATKSSGGGDSASARKAIEDLTRDLDKKTFNVTYDVKSESSPGKFGIIQKNGKSAISFDLDGDSVIVIDDGKNTFFCTKAPNEDGVCLKSDSGDDDLFLNPDDIVDEVKKASSVKELASRKIAGKDARCFEEVTDGATSIVCLDKSDGVMLYAKGDDSEFTATQLKTSVDDKVFVPPYKVLNLGN